MSDSIHGHEVIHFIMENSKNFSKENLKNAIAERFGADTRFHTCSAEGMTAEQLIEFIAQKGILADTDSGFKIQVDKMCQH